MVAKVHRNIIMTVNQVSNETCMCDSTVISYHSCFNVGPASQTLDQCMLSIGMLV